MNMLSNVVSLDSHRNVNAAMSSMVGKREMRVMEDEQARLDACYFPVHKSGLKTVAGLDISSHQAVIRGDTGESIAVVGKGYELINNSEIFGAFNSALVKSDLDLEGMKIDVCTSHSGARSFVRYNFPAHQINVNESTNDTIDMQMLVINSYDGSSAFRSMVGGWRALCSNNMIIGSHFAQAYGKHTKNLNIDAAADKLTIAASAYVTAGEEWKRMYDTPVSLVEVEAVLKKLAGKSENKLELLQAQFAREAKDLGMTKWALFNAITHWSTHTEVKRSVQNAASTVVKREDDVRKVIVNKVWTDIGQAA